MTALLFACLLTSPAARELPEDVPSFRNEVMPVLSRSGCNLGTCHGNQHGKGGLQLSLRGQNPEQDYFTLARDLGGRRVNVLTPESSLLLQKPTAAVPHQGGKRFEPGSRAHSILSRWIAAGMPRDADDAPAVTSLQVTPDLATVYAPQQSARIQAVANFSDGSTRDVTELCVFEPSSLSVRVSASGVVTADRGGSSSVTVRYLHLQQPVRLEFVPAREGFQWQSPEAQNFIDEAVFAKLKRLRLAPASRCDDTVFLRRVYLDLTGLLPPTEGARRFLASGHPEKRSRLIDELLASPEFADFQALRWSDLLRVEEKTLDKKGVEVFHDWIRASFADGKPLNQFAAELLAARGSTYENPPANFYRALRSPSARAEATAQVFLGIRLQCAKCHNHPFDRWTQEDYYGWSNFFAHVDYRIEKNKRRDKFDKHEFSGDQIVLIKPDAKDVVNPDTGQPAGLRFLGEAADSSLPNQDRLQRLAAWLSNRENSRFAATQVNRLWFQMMGRGLVDPVDDFRSTNPATHPELLHRLTEEFVASNFDVRHVFRLIANSATYQLASGVHSPGSHPGDYAAAQVRRLTAEQTLDGIARVLGVGVPYGGHKYGTLAVQLRGVRNSFAHRFSPPAVGDRFLALFGKPGRLQTCECERSNDATLAQTFELVSGELISMLTIMPTTAFATAVAEGTPDDAIVEDLYWSALSRAPSEKELQAALDHIASYRAGNVGFQDVAWALLNSNEFLLRR